MVAQNGVHRDISECFINLAITFVKTLRTLLDRGFPNAMVHYITSEINVGNILQRY